MDETGTRSIADPYADLLARLPPHRRLGLIASLANGYYDGWRPSRSEVEDLVALETGRMTLAEYKERGHRRGLR